jgi:hypothetical protein
MSAPKVDWLQVPELEEKLSQADALPPDLNRLTECVRLIAAALNKEDVVIEMERSAIAFTSTIQNRRYSQTVSLKNECYFVTHPSWADVDDTCDASTAHLAWTILGFPFTPKDARERLEKAAELGIPLKPGHVPLGMPSAKWKLTTQSEKPNDDA